MDYPRPTTGLSSSAASTDATDRISMYSPVLDIASEGLIKRASILLIPWSLLPCPNNNNTITLVKEMWQTVV